LHPGKTQRRQPRRNRIHADFRIDQHVRPIGQDPLAPVSERHRALDKTIEHRNSGRGIGILPDRGVVAVNLEPVAIDLADPALYRHLPYRVTPEMAADDTDPDLLSHRRWRWQWRGRKRTRHDIADKSAVPRLQFAIVAALVGEIERLTDTDPAGQERRINAVARHIAQRLETP